MAESASDYPRALQTLVLDWYSANGRRLPWRETQDAYLIWLSEIMLQQTTVAAVIPYFQRFTLRFPTVQSLAAASVDDVLRYWEGLGYYSRARNLHRAAGVICEELGGVFPRTVEGLQKLPGIGRYTAGAIAGFAWDLPAPILEANTERLYARLLALAEPSDSTGGRKKLWEFAESIVPGRRAGDFNQALMDLGSRICTPVDPRCGECPLSGLCRARLSGAAERFPVRRPRPGVTEVSELAVVFERRGEVLLRQRELRERWAGMHDFPRLELSAEQFEEIPCVEWLSERGGATKRGSSGPAGSVRATGPAVQRAEPLPRGRSLFPVAGEELSQELKRSIAGSTGIDAGKLLGAVRTTYAVTRYRVSLIVVQCVVPESVTAQAGWSWHAVQDLDGLAMPTTGRKIVNWLRSRTA
ncbi:MAG: A/G-specific adenine glycosylase [Planctomycetota bacterium]